MKNNWRKKLFLALYIVGKRSGRPRLPNPFRRFCRVNWVSLGFKMQI